MALGGISATPLQAHNACLRLGASEELLAAGRLAEVRGHYGVPTNK